ncbi:hypothetical protein PO883_31385 [Massilia sp. DJPM01]|uniref:hypothetical protein n=1 Tax=Massilia sp. DJPM01 TaxID=3024404 RepID=UPI00259D8D34|nr:hypothetical protein [Massilia sp. DJPM01]MDM5181684.1 hypothetical protein [Massilia sp. DJPM01]
MNALNAAGRFDADRHWRGNLRALYDAMRKYEGERVWDDVFLARWTALEDAGAYFGEIRRRAGSLHAWPELLEGESENLYCASRLSDVMLLRFQHGGSGYAGPDITSDNYAALFAHLGFRAELPSRFHPFWCEVVEVSESSGDTIEMTGLLWPALLLGNMMFSRAGVSVSAPAHLLARGIADQSALYWSYWRKNRKTIDLSMGWGSNSQWGTDLRRDFDLGDRYAYNVDGGNKRIDLRLPLVDDDEQAMDYMDIADRIDFLRNRCLTRSDMPGGSDFWPYDDYFEELKDGERHP